LVFLDCNNTFSQKELLGRGANGSVWKVTNDNKLYAVKRFVLWIGKRGRKDEEEKERKVRVG
jgi:hypothetical protein